MHPSQSSSLQSPFVLTHLRSFIRKKMSKECLAEPFHCLLSYHGTALLPKFPSAESPWLPISQGFSSPPPLPLLSALAGPVCKVSCQAAVTPGSAHDETILDLIPQVAVVLPWDDLQVSSYQKDYNGRTSVIYSDPPSCHSNIHARLCKQACQ